MFEFQILALKGGTEIDSLEECVVDVIYFYLPLPVVNHRTRPFKKPPFCTVCIMQCDITSCVSLCN